MPLSVDRLRELLNYDPETGVFTWKVYRSHNALPGMVAGRHRPDSYWVLSIDGRKHYGHRLAWLYVHGEWPSKHLDHRDNNPSNNAISNLREANDAENGQNLHGPKKGNSSGYLGVRYHRGARKFNARIWVDGKEKYLGLFETAEEAYDVYLAAKKEHHPFGEIAR